MIMIETVVRKINNYMTTGNDQISKQGWFGMIYQISDISVLFVGPSPNLLVESY